MGQDSALDGVLLRLLASGDGHSVVTAKALSYEAGVSLDASRQCMEAYLATAGKGSVTATAIFNGKGVRV